MTAANVPPPTASIATIGHGLQPIEAFIGNLLRHQVDVVVDVRSHPTSSRAPHFDRGALAVALQDAGIAYEFLGDTLGGRPPDHLRTASGLPDYDRMRASAGTASELDRIAARAGHERIALMCSESNPDECHRSRMLAPALEERGVVVEHILVDGSLKTQMTLL